MTGWILKNKDCFKGANLSKDLVERMRKSIHVEASLVFNYVGYFRGRYIFGCVND
jgi:hypothetical protein